MATIYITKALMLLLYGERELIQLTDRASTHGRIVDEVLDRAMQTAESEVNSYVGASYTLPLSEIPEVLKNMTGDIARYRLYDNSPSDEVTKRYDRAVSWLKDVSKGVVSLGIPDTASAQTPSTVVSSSRPQVFSESAFRKMGPTW